MENVFGVVKKGVKAGMLESLTKSRKKISLTLSLTLVILCLTSSILFGCVAEGTTTEREANLQERGKAKPFDGRELVISGSTTLLQVSEAWASAFMETYGGTVIVNGGGSGVGIADLINGTTDLANASRQIKDEELEKAKANGLDVQEYKVLYDGIAIIVSSNVIVEELSIEQLSKIYTGKITNWKEVGGEDAKIVVVARDSSSGTGEYFLEEVVQLGKTAKENDYSELCLRLQSNADVANTIRTTKNAIGYIGLGYLEESLNSVRVQGVLPSIETVKDGAYPISRGLYIYTLGGDLSDIAKAYLDFVMSDEGQEIGLREGFVPIR